MSDSKQEIVVTGVNGFVGEHLARHLQAADFLVRGIGRETTPSANVTPYLDSYDQADLLDKTQTGNVTLKNARAIIHLAGLASVADSFNNPELYKTGNAEMTANLLDAAQQQDFKGRVVAISTGAIYDAAQPMPLSESSNTAESSPYAVGKLRAEDVIKERRAAGMDVVIVRPFNHIGPGQGKGFLVGDLYDQLVIAKEEGSSEILVGNLETRRDYTDVRDIVDAYTKLAIAPSLEFDTYNVCSGISYSGFDILGFLKNAMELTDIEVVVDPSRFRPSDAMEITGTAKRLQNELGWQPASNVETAIKDFVVRRQN